MEYAKEGESSATPVLPSQRRHDTERMMGSRLGINLTTGLAFAAVPALALALFGPSAWQAVAKAPAVGAVPTNPRAATVEQRTAALPTWQETFNPTPAQVAELNAFYKQQQLQYQQTFQMQSAQSLAFLKSHYVGNRLATYLHLLYKNQTINNVNFTSYRRALVNSLYQNGVVSSTPYTFRPLI
jgi:hypothetical protein